MRDLRVLLMALLLMPQIILKSQISDVGVSEHLGDTVALDAWFLNEKNDTVILKDLVNKPTVFSFVYFDCPGLCSPLLDGISDVIEKSDMKLGEDYQVVTISFNYRDTPEKAKEKKVNFLRDRSKQNSGAWIYLTGDSTNIHKILSSVGYKVKPMGVDFAHPSALVVVSPEGKVTRYLYGLTFLPFDLKMAVIEAQKGLARPTINKVLEMCFSYDPQGQTYTLQVTRIAGGIIIFFGLLIFLVLALKPKSKAAKN